MEKRGSANARAQLCAAIRSFFLARRFDEVETPCLVPAPAMEPHIDAFEAAFVPGTGGGRQSLWLHSSPEYAMKRLLAAGWERIFQIARVFRNGEVSTHHNPEFTLLELYRTGTDYRGIMEDVETLVERCAQALSPSGEAKARRGQTELDLSVPFERMTVAEAFSRLAGIDLSGCSGNADALRAAAVTKGFPVGPEGEGFDDLFFRVFLEAIEPRLGQSKPTFLLDWPASMAALARLKPEDPRWAERFELYAGGLELANGFSELNDAGEQRRRLVEEQALRRRLGRPVYPIDERFVEAVGEMPPASGVAVGLDRLLMLLTGAEKIEDVLLFPAREFLE
jgi:lysyl-tRNA synthetase class 2